MKQKTISAVMKMIGSVRSQRKADAARLNGKKGGRPKMPFATRAIKINGAEYIVEEIQCAAPFGVIVLDNSECSARPSIIRKNYLKFD